MDDLTKKELEEVSADGYIPQIGNWEPELPVDPDIPDREETSDETSEIPPDAPSPGEPSPEEPPPGESEAPDPPDASFLPPIDM